MKKVTLKAIKDMLSTTLFLRTPLNIFNNTNQSDDNTQRIIIVMYRYHVEITINYDIQTIYINFSGSLDGFDAKEWLTIIKDLKALCFVGK